MATQRIFEKRVIVPTINNTNHSNNQLLRYLDGSEQLRIPRQGTRRTRYLVVWVRGQLNGNVVQHLERPAHLPKGDGAERVCWTMRQQRHQSLKSAQPRETVIHHSQEHVRGRLQRAYQA